MILGMEGDDPEDQKGMDDDQGGKKEYEDIVIRY